MAKDIRVVQPVSDDADSIEAFRSPQRSIRFMSKAFAFPCLLTLALLLSVLSHPTGAQERRQPSNPAAACLAFKDGLSLGAPLAFTRAKLLAGGTLRIVAFGSSSTTGFGTFGSPFPDVMKQQLLRLHPSVKIQLINSGRIMEDLGDNVARIDRDVLRYKPDLLIWQIGTNDVVWRGIADRAEEILSKSVRRIKATGTDVVLLDLQYAPLVLASSRYVRMEKIIADVAGQQKVGHFPRFILMKRAVDAGVTSLVAWDGLHNSADGHICIGVALADMIDAAVRR